MQHESSATLDSEIRQPDCAFCQHSSLASYILKETPMFRIVTDHAPLLEGHILIIPKQHYACYGVVPSELDAELLILKREVQEFFARFYASPIFWEHGIFRQTVFHAHLHCFPFGDITYDLSHALHGLVIASQDDLRQWHSGQGHYFYLEDHHNAVVFPASMDHYLPVIKDVLWAGVTKQRGPTTWLSPQQRQEEGKLLIQATIAKWRTFQQQEGH